MKRPTLQSGGLLAGMFLPQPSWPSVCPRCHIRFSGSRAKRRVTRPILPEPSQKRQQSSVAAAVEAAQSYFSNGRSEDPPLTGGVKIDPFQSVAEEMKFLTGNIRQLVGSGHPVLYTVSKYYTQSEGKYIRPMLVLLMSQATAITPKCTQSNTSEEAARIIDEPLSPRKVPSDIDPSIPSGSPTSTFSTTSMPDLSILPTQRRLAEITELIHTASLLHDDVIDTSTARRDAPSANIAFGNKMAVLAGDFLLGRASVALARLRNSEITELLATAIANLVEGEFMQLRNTLHDEANPSFSQESIEYYLQKTYLKSASLISKSCRAAALLGNAEPHVVELAYSYGRNLGLAIQLVDDMLDYRSSERDLGSPAGADLELGLATAPLLFAWRERSELGTLVGRKFAEVGDVRRARELVLNSDGLEQTRVLAQEHADSARKAIENFPDSEAKDGLLEMCTKVMQRR